MFYQAAGNVRNNGCHDKLDEGKVQEMVTGMLGDVSVASNLEDMHASIHCGRLSELYPPKGMLKVVPVATLVSHQSSVFIQG